MQQTLNKFHTFVDNTAGSACQVRPTYGEPCTLAAWCVASREFNEKLNSV